MLKSLRVRRRFWMAISFLVFPWNSRPEHVPDRYSNCQALFLFFANSYKPRDLSFCNVPGSATKSTENSVVLGPDLDVNRHLDWARSSRLRLLFRDLAFVFLHVATVCPKTIIDVQYMFPFFVISHTYCTKLTGWKPHCLLDLLIPSGPYSFNLDLLCVLCDPTYREAAHVCESNTWRQPRLPHGRLHIKINYLLNDQSEHIRPSKNMYCWHYSFVDASPCLWNPSVWFRSCLQRPPTSFLGKS